MLTDLVDPEVEGAAEQAAQLFAPRREVPHDFTHFLSEEYEELPEEVCLYSRSIGTTVLDWWRYHWDLRSLIEARPDAFARA